jgi:lysophospholipid acyltransferase (LPLAT)-like uncharacterized protein
MDTVKIRSKSLIRLAGRSAAFCTRGLFGTARISIWQTEPLTSPYEPTNEKFLYCLWHDAILGVLFSGNCRHMAGLVSQHEDGSYVADAMEAIGIRPIRGSSSRGGAAALREMMEAASAYHIAIATDGPRGPRREVKDGIIYLASKTGRRIVPVAFAGQSTWKPRGRWTDMVIPKPFSRTIIASGTPLSVPDNLSRAEITAFRLDLQTRMDDLQLRIDAAALDPQVTSIEQTLTLKKESASPSTEIRRAA